MCEPKDSDTKVSTGAVSAAVGGALVTEEEEAASTAQWNAQQSTATSPRR
ncbi:hypothetical protein D187_008650 [Cystobacter fuscus DSM 2262]|uniref:Uncharacterized protein n=1 Tax=Cystobacter fuscus (strain ATCC 25194 / DSM 2262 / NBRC 100088 / M29) TaxID=1242864 RepID=S9PJ70_CYSF2|nr:hypothetical protein D187_008650 [Cystobacter fuscus DSM 2262]